MRKRQITSTTARSERRRETQRGGSHAALKALSGVSMRGLARVLSLLAMPVGVVVLSLAASRHAVPTPVAVGLACAVCLPEFIHGLLRPRRAGNASGVSADYTPGGASDDLLRLSQQLEEAIHRLAEVPKQLRLGSDAAVEYALKSMREKQEELAKEGKRLKDQTNETLRQKNQADDELRDAQTRLGDISTNLRSALREMSCRTVPSTDDTVKAHIRAIQDHVAGVQEMMKALQCDLARVEGSVGGLPTATNSSASDKVKAIEKGISRLHDELADKVKELEAESGLVAAYARGILEVQGLALRRPAQQAATKATKDLIGSQMNEILTILRASTLRTDQIEWLASATRAASLLRSELPRWKKLYSDASTSEPEIWPRPFLAVGDLLDQLELQTDGDVIRTLELPHDGLTRPDEGPLREAFRNYLITRVWAKASTTLCCNEYVQRMAAVAMPSPQTDALVSSTAKLAGLVRCLLEAGGVVPVDMTLFLTKLNLATQDSGSVAPRFSGNRTYEGVAGRLATADLMPQGSLMEIQEWGYTMDTTIRKARVVPYIKGAG